jgi:hypothetical protein
MFNPITYFENIQKTLKATANYKFAKVSGLSHLEQVLQNLKRNKKFLAISDIDDGMTYEGGGSAYYERRTYTVFILLRTGQHGDVDVRNEKMSEARSIYRQILSKIIKDKVYTAEMNQMNTDKIQFNEIPGALLSGLTGLYFTFSVDNPINLVYDEEQWTE